MMFYKNSAPGYFFRSLLVFRLPAVTVAEDEHVEVAAVHVGEASFANGFAPGR
jgi:hypothetical protein